MNRIVQMASALFWGLQFAFLIPSLALMLSSLYRASSGQIGVVLMVYNAVGFLVAIAIPAWADRIRNYLTPMMVCALMTIALAGVLLTVHSLVPAAIALSLLGAPAGVGNTLYFANLRHSGATPTEVVHTRAVVSFAWVAGPPLATFLIAREGPVVVAWLLGVVGIANLLLTLAQKALAKQLDPASFAQPGQDPEVPVSKIALVLIVTAFVLMQATNNTNVSIMNLHVVERLHLPIEWAGVALAVAAAAEIPALLAVGWLAKRWSSMALVAQGCLVGVLYFIGMAYASNPWLVIALQLLNAWFFAIIAGVGLTLFQQVIAAPGLASGIYTNTRRIGAILTGPMIGFAALTSMGYSGVFLLSAAITALALVLVIVVARGSGGPAKPEVSGTPAS